MAWGSVTSPMSTAVRPGVSGTSSISSMWGRRRSPPTSTTRSPDWAKAMARLTATMVLPSAGDGLVTCTTRTWRSTPRNLTAVRSRRNASAAGADGWLMVTTPTPASNLGMRPRVGTEVTFSTISFDLTESSK